MLPLVDVKNGEQHARNFDAPVGIAAAVNVLHISSPKPIFDAFPRTKPCQQNYSGGRMMGILFVISPTDWVAQDGWMKCSLQEGWESGGQVWVGLHGDGNVAARFG
ncbi:hypothetical protein NE237_031561 [Protea cynaroides]|uniref:Uncharacterized protein n=1 Tax=Protea cynaroides TaxID=273540 RepID=A0A9Q0L2I5_9MAGN|nr:hypothetical protein NE237_031561 [Protea cynaroides]